MMRHLLHNSEFRFNEVLFENRNKSYGAFVLRNEEGNILRRSLFIGVAFVVIIAVSPLVINILKPKVPEKIPVGQGHILKPIPIDEAPEKTPEIVKPAVTPPRTLESTVKMEIPTPTRNAVKETPATKLSDTENTNIGTETVIGTPSTGTYTPAAQIGTVEGTDTATVPTITVPKVIDNTPKTTVDIEADFLGGINVFRSKVVNNFDTSIMEGSGELVKTTVTFIVEKDGTISDIKAAGPNKDFNKEAEKTIKSVKGKWTPAKLNGENVRSYFKFPIMMQFE